MSRVSSISALRPRGLTTYTTSKAAVIGLTQAMAVDHGPQGVRVNCIAPTAATKMLEGLLPPVVEVAALVASGVVLYAAALWMADPWGRKTVASGEIRRLIKVNRAG